MDEKGILWLRTAVKWLTSTLNGRVYYTNSNIGGCIVVDLATQMVMVLNSHPSESEIQEAMQVQRSYPTDLPLQSRFLEAESHAIMNQLEKPRVSANPFDLFRFMLTNTAIVGTYLVNSKESRYSLLRTGLELSEYQYALSQVAEAKGDELQLLLNKLQVLTGVYSHPGDLHRVLGVTRGGQYVEWLEAWIPDSPADCESLGDLLESRQLRCTYCNSQYPVMYTYGDEGSRIEALYTAWQFHEEEHYGCRGSLSGA